MKPMKTGVKGRAKTRVTLDKLASSAGSGAVDVFSTPNLVLLMEEAAVDALHPYMGEEECTVGSSICIRHLSPTPPGLEVTATATLTKVDGRRLVFHVQAHDEVEMIGEGTHERYIVSLDQFISRAALKSTRENTSSVEG